MQRRHCMSEIADDVQKVDSSDGPARKRRRLSTLIETPKVPSVAQHLTYTGQNEPRPCNSRQTAALPPRQSVTLPPCQSVALPLCQPVSLPTPVLSRSSTHSSHTSQHLLRTRRSSPTLRRHMTSTAADVERLRQHGVSTRQMSTSRPSLTRSRSDVSRDSLMTSSRDDMSHLSSDIHHHHHHHYQHHQDATTTAAYLSTSPESSVYLTSPPAGYPTVVPPTPPTYLPLPLTAPVTAADLACYVALPTAPVSNPYLAAAMRPSAPSWPAQSGISVVPAAVLAADVLPEYYYGLSHEQLAATHGYTQSAFHLSAPAMNHQQQQQQQQHYVSTAPVAAHQSTDADSTIYAERRQNMNTTGNGVSPYHMTQLPHDMTQLAGDMTQIRHRPPPVYASDQRAADTARSRQHLAEMEAFTRRSVDARDWSMLTQSSEHAQPLFVHQLLRSMLESTLGTTHNSPQHFYTVPQFHNYEALLGLARQLSESKPKGMCKTDIDRLASFQYTSSTASHLSHDSAVKQSNGSGDGAVTQTSCVVCMSEFVNRQRIRELPCQHIFHLKCIDKWLKTNRTCPLCRADVLDLLNSDSKQFIR